MSWEKIIAINLNKRLHIVRRVTYMWSLVNLLAFWHNFFRMSVKNNRKLRERVEQNNGLEQF